MTDQFGRSTKKGQTGPSRGSIGGSAAEAGAAFRSGVAAWVVAHGLRGVELPNLFSSIQKSVPIRVELESDFPVDDIAVTFVHGESAYIQAKRSIDFSFRPGSEFAAAVDQWRKAAATSEIDLGRTRLILVTQSPSERVKILALALNRNSAEFSGAFTSGERVVLDKLRDAFRDMSNDRRGQLLKAIRIIRLDLEADATGDAGIAIGHLDGWVVPSGDGVKAWRALKGKVSDLAALRQGLSIEGWMATLRAAGLTLVSDAQKSASAKREAAMLVEAAYRTRLASDGTLIDLRPLGAPLAPFDAEDTLCAIKVEPPALGTDANPQHRGRDLFTAFRRRGRCLLLGLPGSGKSTALRAAAAHWAKESTWPLPLLVNLRDLNGVMQRFSPLDALIDQATRDFQQQERELLANLMRAGAADGVLAIFLDGLDEIRDSRLDMVNYIERLLKQIHADVEVFVSTRDVGYAQASTLGFKELRLLPPGRTKPLLRRVLTKLAEQDGKLRKDQRQQWVSQRLTWVEAILKNDHQLEETPLMPLMITLLAADAGGTPLGKSRAEIISLVVESVARRSEMVPGRTKLGSLSADEARNALIEAFETTGMELLKRNSVSRPDALAFLTPVFQDRWGMPAGPARTAADVALHFWDEAGIIVAEGAEAQLSARIRMFAEIGAARFLSRGSLPELRQSLRELVSDETSYDALLLAAELSPGVSAELIEIAKANRSLELELILGRAVAEGGTTTSAALMTLIGLLVARIGSDQQEGWEVAKAIVRVQVPAERREAVFAAIDSNLTQKHATLAKAVASITWGPVDIELIRAALRAGPPLKWAPSGNGKPRARRSPYFVDDGFTFLVERAAEQILPGHPEIAPDVAAGAGQSSVGTLERAFELLAQHGHNDLVEERWKHLSAGSLTSPERLQRYVKGTEIFLRSIADLGVQVDVPRYQRRRLDEIADYVATLQMDEAGIVAVDHALFGPAQDLRDTMKAVQVLGAFDPNILSSQVTNLLTESKSETYHDVSDVLFDGGTARRLDRWTVPEDRVELEGRLVRLLGSKSQWLASLAATALSTSEGDRALVHAIESKIAGLNIENRSIAARLVCHLDQSVARVDGWTSAHDPILREAAAALAGHMFRTTGIAEEKLAKFLSDRDLGVKAATIRSLAGSDLPSSLIEQMRIIAADVGGSWTCRYCELINPGTVRACEKCRVVGPDPQNAAAMLLPQGSEKGRSAQPAGSGPTPIS